jgi:hypothetical protein
MVDIEEAKLQLEREKLNLEADKLRFEQSKFDSEAEKRKAEIAKAQADALKTRWTKGRDRQEVPHETVSTRGAVQTIPLLPRGWRKLRGMRTIEVPVLQLTLTLQVQFPGLFE